MSDSHHCIPTSYHPLKAGSIDGTDKDAHDNAVIRAMNAKYKPNKAVNGDPQCTLFVTRLNPQTTNETLKQVFSQYGALEKCRVIRDIVTGYSKCYAFIEYEDAKSARKAYHSCNKIGIDDHEILVEFECERLVNGWIPRRLGGGWGGNKKSGQLRFGGRDRPFRKPYVVDHERYNSGSRDKSYRNHSFKSSKRDYHSSSNSNYNHERRRR